MAVSEKERKRRLALLIEEAPSRLAERLREPKKGEYALPFIGEARATYYSVARRNMQTYTAWAVMTHCQQLDDLDVMKRWKKEKKN